MSDFLALMDAKNRGRYHVIFAKVDTIYKPRLESRTAYIRRMSLFSILTLFLSSSLASIRFVSSKITWGVKNI